MKTINELVNKSFPSKPRNFAIGNNDMPYHYKTPGLEKDDDFENYSNWFELFTTEDNKLFSADEKKKALESFK